MRKASEFVSALGHVLRGDGDNRTSLLFPNGSRIVGLPGSEGTIRGFSNVSMLLIDEASLVPDALFDAVTPMLAVSDGDLWIMSTPRGKQGFFYNEWQNGSADWLRVRGTVESATHIRPTFLAEEKRRKSDAIFRQEYECEFVAIDGALFDEAALRRMVTDEFKPLVHV